MFIHVNIHLQIPGVPGTEDPCGGVKGGHKSGTVYSVVYSAQCEVSVLDLLQCLFCSALHT